MPMFDYHCSRCDRNTEELFRAQDAILDMISCEHCGSDACKIMSPHADMNRMWAGQAGTGGGVNGYMDRGLGVRVHSAWEADKIAESRGLVREQDYKPHFVEDFAEKRREQVVAQDKQTETYNANVKKYDGDKIKAMTETFTAKDCLDDKVSSGY